MPLSRLLAMLALVIAAAALTVWIAARADAAWGVVALTALAAAAALRMRGRGR